MNLRGLHACLDDDAMGLGLGRAADGARIL